MGHDYRVARIAGSLPSALPTKMDPADRQAADLAARAHELGRLLGPAATPTELASRTAQLLYDLGVESRVLRVTNHIRERWNGAGGPHGLHGDDIPLPSRIVALADALDHAAVVLLDSGLEPAAAVGAALTEVKADAELHYGRVAADALETATGVIEAIWVLARAPTRRPSPPDA